MPDFELEPQESDDDHVTQMGVVGELDLTNAHELEECLDDLARDDGSVLLLDLNRVVFVDSAALHMLFRIASRRGRGRFGIVVATTAPIARTLGIVGLPQAVVTGESAQAVLAALDS